MATPFHSGTFKVKLVLPSDYPASPPKGPRALPSARRRRRRRSVARRCPARPRLPSPVRRALTALSTAPRPQATF